MAEQTVLRVFCHRRRGAHRVGEVVANDDGLALRYVSCLLHGFPLFMCDDEWNDRTDLEAVHLVHKIERRRTALHPQQPKDGWTQISYSLPDEPDAILDVPAQIIGDRIILDAYCVPCGMTYWMIVDEVVRDVDAGTRAHRLTPHETIRLKT